MGQPKMPEQKPAADSNPSDTLYGVSLAVAWPVLPILRSRWGSDAFSDAWKGAAYMFVYAGVTDSPEIASCLPAWVVAVAFRRITCSHHEESTYRGRPWLGGLFARRERNARLIETALVFAAAYSIGGAIGQFLLLAALGLHVMFVLDSMAIRANERLVRDAQIRAYKTAGLQRGERRW